MSIDIEYVQLHTLVKRNDQLTRSGISTKIKSRFAENRRMPDVYTDSYLMSRSQHETNAAQNLEMEQPNCYDKTTERMSLGAKKKKKRRVEATTTTIGSRESTQTYF